MPSAAAPIDPLTFLGVLLAALGVLLTALAIMIAIAAIWGYAGIKEAAAKAATDAMALKMKEYPEPQTMLEMVSRMENILGSWNEIQNQLVTGAVTKPVAPASDAGVQQEPTVAPPYPGQEVQNVGTAPANLSAHDPGASDAPDTDANPR